MEFIYSNTKDLVISSKADGGWRVTERELSTPRRLRTPRWETEDGITFTTVGETDITLEDAVVFSGAILVGWEADLSK